MGVAGYTVGTAGTAIALSASATKSVFSVVPGAKSVILKEIGVTFDGTSATAGKVKVQLCQSTQATTGTSTSQTPVQGRGKSQAALASGAVNFTAEPTALTVVKEWSIDSTTGQTIQFPLGAEPESDNTNAGTACKAWVIRCVTPSGVSPNLTGYVEFEEE